MDKYSQANAILSKFSRDYMALKKSLPIRPSEMGALNIISEYNGRATPVAVAELLGVSKAMVATHLAVLEEKGYIIRRPSETDRRSCYLLPTEKAKELVKSAKTSLNRYLSKIEKTLGADQFDLFVNLADQAQKIIGQELK